MKLRFGQIFLVASIISLIVTVLWLAYPSRNRSYHLILTGMGRGRIQPVKARFEPYQGRRMGGFAGMAAVIKETVASFSGEPFNIFSIGTELSGTADSYLTRGASIVKLMNALGTEAMLASNIEFTYGLQRLAELSALADFAFISSNVSESESGRVPSYLTPELILSPGMGLRVGLLGVTPPATPNLTARANVAGLEFAQPDESLRMRVEALRKAGVDLVILLTQYSRDRITLSEWRAVASAAPDVCVLLDFDMEAPPVVRKDGIVVTTISGYNQTKEIDVLDLELTPPPVRIVKTGRRRLPVDLAEITPDDDMLALVEQETRQTKALRETMVGQFAEDYNKSYNSECYIGNLITDAMLAETKAEIAFQNSGGIQGNIQAGDFTLGDLYSVMPFDNQMVQMQLKGSDVLEVLKIAAGRQRGVLQVAGLRYTYKNDGAGNFALKTARIGDVDIDPERLYQVAVNNFLADGGDNFLPFQRGQSLVSGRQQRDVVRDHIAALSREGPVSLRIEGRIVAEE
ncbi:MAG: bifunctional UDP-sugar hydrolase/5'-nucleotidase [Candidatus Riflebacteria bacterium]|nr:bifunctional UDP-sugar hydrolase/5'-nucleotidase [Candidatus Riflebacteria bacterium]